MEISRVQLHWPLLQADKARMPSTFHGPWNMIALNSHVNLKRFRIGSVSYNNCISQQFGTVGLPTLPC